MYLILTLVMSFAQKYSLHTVSLKISILVDHSFMCKEAVRAPKHAREQELRDLKVL
jgi:hypothetical protein